MEQNNNFTPETIALQPVIEPQSPKPMERFALVTKDRIFAVLILVASCLLTLFGIWGGFNGGFSVSAIILFIIQTIYLFKKGAKSFVAYLYGLFYPLTSVSFIITTNGTVKFASFVLMFLLNIVWFKSVSAKEKSRDDSSLILNSFAYLFKGMFKNLPKSLVSFFSGDKEKRKSPLGVLLGLAISIPALLVIIPLLMSSDVAFSGLIESLFGNFFGNTFKIIVGITLGIFITSYCFTLKKDSGTDIVKYEFAGIYNTPIVTFVSVLSGCYFLYLFSQLAYFFSAFGGFLPKDYEFTVAEYARKGFFEMAVIAAINLVIILGVFALSTKKNGKLCISLKLLCGFISLFTLLIIATAISKMVLYISSFGMTILRIGTTSFMAFLTVVFLAVILKLFVTKVKLIKTALITAGIILTVLGTVNINSVVASYNYNAYNNSVLEEIDIETIYELGDEGIPYIVKLTQSENKNIANEAQEYVIRALKYSDLYQVDYYIEVNGFYYDTVFTEKKSDSIGHYNISSQKAKNALKEYIENNKTDLVINNNMLFL